MLKTQKTRLFAIILALACALSAAASATDMRASHYLDKYEIDAVATGRGEIAIKISVNGTGSITCLGADKITIYEYLYGRWIVADIFDRNDSSMVGTNTNSFVNTIYFSGYEDTEYKVCVTVFAEDSTGSDSRYQEVYVNT